MSNSSENSEIKKVVLTDDYLDCVLNLTIESERKTRYKDSRASFKQLPKETRMRLKDTRPEDIDEDKDLYYLYPQHTQLFKFDFDVNLNDALEFAVDALVVKKRSEYKRMKDGDKVIANTKIVKAKVSDLKKSDSNAEKATEKKVDQTFDLVTLISTMDQNTFESYIANKPEKVKTQLIALYAMIQPKK